MNEYLVKLINEEGCKFDESTFTTLKTAKAWAKGRGGEKYKVIIQKNYNYKGMQGFAEKTYEYETK